MPRVYKDGRGTEVKVGQLVAFNYSGDVALGHIQLVGATGIIHIKRVTHLGHRTNEISKVKNSRGLLVLGFDDVNLILGTEEEMQEDEYDPLTEFASVDEPDEQIVRSALYNLLTEGGRYFPTFYWIHSHDYKHVVVRGLREGILSEAEVEAIKYNRGWLDLPL